MQLESLSYWLTRPQKSRVFKRVLGPEIELQKLIILRVFQFFVVFSNFEGVPVRIYKKEKHFLRLVFCQESESAIRFAKKISFKI